MQTNIEHETERVPDAQGETREAAPDHQADESDPNPASAPNLTPGSVINDRHTKYLAQRGVGPATALSAGLFSADPDEIQRLLCSTEAAASPGLVIPYWEPGDKAPFYYRVRLDEERDDGQRFLVPSGLEVPLYVATASARAPDEPLVVVEGPVKALALAEIGYAAVGLGGVSTTLAKSVAPTLGESWQRVPINGRRVYIAFDAGAATNPLVAHAETRLGRALVAAGADVFVVRTPMHVTAGSRTSEVA